VIGQEQGRYVRLIPLLLLLGILPVSGWSQDEEAVLGVVLGKSGFKCGRNCAIGSDGTAVYGDGRGNYITSNGFVYESGKSFVASDNTYVSKSSGLFYGSKSAIPAGMAYMSSTSTFVGRPVVLRKP
jgi:hypothetical protein